MALTNLERLAAEFERQYAPVLDKIYKEIAAGIENVRPQDAAAFIKKILNKYGINEQTQKIMLDFIAKGAAVGIGAKKIADPVMFKKLWLDRVYDSYGVKFSSRINDLSRSAEMIGIIKEGLRVTRAWNAVSQDILKTGMQAGDVSKVISEAISNARKIGRLTDDAEFAAKYVRDIRRAQASIDTLADRSTLRKAYQRLVDLSESASQKGIDRAIYYAVRAKQRQNAERVAITEISRAYGQARIVEVQGDSDVIGMKSNLNPSHDVPDICDFYAEADQFGMGPGVFPKTHLPPYPYHPYCQCALDAVYSGETQEATGEDFTEKGGEKYLKNLSAEAKRDLLGVEGAEQFKDNPEKWPDLLKSYNEPERVTAKIPEEVLYGK